MASIPDLHESATLVAPDGRELLWVCLCAYRDGRWRIDLRGLQPPCRTAEGHYAGGSEAREVLAAIYDLGRPLGRWYVYQYAREGSRPASY